MSLDTFLELSPPALILINRGIRIRATSVPKMASPISKITKGRYTAI
jgi:hypothetical protein